MPKAKKAATPTPPMNPNLVNSFLAKARSVVSSVVPVQGDKRKLDGDGTLPPATKPKSVPPPPPKLNEWLGSSPSPQVSKPAPPTSPLMVQKPPQPAAKSKALTLTAVPLPKNPSQQVSAPNPKSLPKPVEKTPSPALSSGSTASERTREVLQKAKQAHLAAQAAKDSGEEKTKTGVAEAKEKSPPTPEELVTPPPKVSAYASPQVTPSDPVKELSRDFDGDHNHGESWGKSWWNGWGWDYGSWSHDWGYNWRNQKSWTVDSSYSTGWSQESLEQQDQESKPTNPNADQVRQALALRKPSELSHSPDASGEIPKEDAPPGDTVEAPNAEVDEVEGGEPTDKTWPPVDKFGNPLTAHALYMRFYRALRSTLS